MNKSINLSWAAFTVTTFAIGILLLNPDFFSEISDNDKTKWLQLFVILDACLIFVISASYIDKRKGNK